MHLEPNIQLNSVTGVLICHVHKEEKLKFVCLFVFIFSFSLQFAYLYSRRKKNLILACKNVKFKMIASKSVIPVILGKSPHQLVQTQRKSVVTSLQCGKNPHFLFFFEGFHSNTWKMLSINDLRQAPAQDWAEFS